MPERSAHPARPLAQVLESWGYSDRGGSARARVGGVGRSTQKQCGVARTGPAPADVRAADEAQEGELAVELEEAVRERRARDAPAQRQHKIERACREHFAHSKKRQKSTSTLHTPGGTLEQHLSQYWEAGKNRTSGGEGGLTCQRRPARTSAPWLARVGRGRTTGEGGLHHARH